MAATMNIVNPVLNWDWLQRTCTGRGTVVAVIDSGVDAEHPELQGKVRQACRVHKNAQGEIGFQVLPGEESRDSYGHGTAVAGVILNLAPQAELVSVKVLNEYNQCSGQELIAGLKWALDQKIKLINMSLATAKKQFVPELMELCEQANTQETIIVAARRNFGDVGWPAVFSSVISVDREDFPDRFLLRYYPRNVIDFGAAGYNLRLPSLHGGYSLLTGTSFATPHITGMIALLLEAFPGLLPAEAKTVLKALSAEPATG